MISADRHIFDMDFGDLVASAEQLTAEIDGVRAGDLPRVERSLKHILDAGQSLLHKVIKFRNKFNLCPLCKYA